MSRQTWTNICSWSGNAYSGMNTGTRHIMRPDAAILCTASPKTHKIINKIMKDSSS